jgi:hypothetical protein
MREAALERLLGGSVSRKESTRIVLAFTRPSVGMLAFHEAVRFVSASYLMTIDASEKRT